MDNYAYQADVARGIFLTYDQEQLIRKFCLDADGRWICLTWLNAPCRICRETGRVEEWQNGQWQECRDFDTVMTIYDLLCFSQGDQAPALAGTWCTVGTFVITGVTQTEKFTGKYAQQFDGRLEELRAAVQALGGVVEPPMAGADLTCRIPVTPFFPVLLQFWQGDAEFAPRLLVLWDRNTDRLLHFETTFYLQGALLRRLSSLLA